MFGVHDDFGGFRFLVGGTDASEFRDFTYSSPFVQTLRIAAFTFKEGTLAKDFDEAAGGNDLPAATPVRFSVGRS